MHTHTITYENFNGETKTKQVNFNLTEAELTKAGRSVARFQKLAATMKDPISGDEAGGLSAGLATSFNISAAGLDQANAMLNRSGQQGGVGA